MKPPQRLPLQMAERLRRVQPDSVANHYKLRQQRPLVRSMTPEAARTVAAAFISCRVDHCNSLFYGLPDTLLRKLQSVQNVTARLSQARDVVITSRRYYANSIGYPSKSVSSSKWHVWFASRSPGKRLSNWHMTVASCSTALGALCSQLTFRVRLAWCREQSAVTATKLLQSLTKRNTDLSRFLHRTKDHLSQLSDKKNGWNCGSSWCHWSEIADFQSIFARGASAVALSKISINTNRKTLRAFHLA